MLLKHAKKARGGARLLAATEHEARASGAAYVFTVFVTYGLASGLAPSTPRSLLAIDER